MKQEIKTVNHSELEENMNTTSESNDLIEENTNNFSDTSTKILSEEETKNTLPTDIIQKMGGTEGDRKEAIELYTGEEEMLVSAYKTKSNPYFVLYESDAEGWINKSKSMEGVTRRQDMPDVYQLNGAIYVINIEALKKTPMNKFTKVKPFEMSEIESADIDTMLDWDYCNFLIEKGYIK